MSEVDLSAFVPNVHFEQIPIKNLVSNQDYQRDLSQSHIERTAEHFDLYQINPVKVSRRDGVNYVFNGQHTIEIVVRASGSRETPVWCMIYDDLTYEHEADIFANQQKFVKPLRPLEVFKANLEAGNPDQLMIKAIIESYGLEIGAYRSPGVITAISTLESIYMKYDYHVLDRVLRLLIGTWEGDPLTLSANFLNAVTRLVVCYGSRLKDTEFKEKLGNLSPKQVIRTARERSNGSMGYAETLVVLYNGKRKNDAFRLNMKQLYAKETSIFEVLRKDEETPEGEEPYEGDEPSSYFPEEGENEDV